MNRRTLRFLARATEKEGKQLAKRVKRGELTRSQVEAFTRLFPADAEPLIALKWLDRWGIR